MKFTQGPLRAGLFGWWLMALALTGCQSEAVRDDGVRETISTSLTEVSAPAAEKPAGNPIDPRALDALSSALLPSVEVAPPAQALEDKRFEISVKDVPAQTFFMSLVEGTPYNMVVHPEVTGTLSLRLKDASIPDILEIARDVYGYEFHRRGNGFEILPRRLQARIYQIDFLNIRRSGASQTRVSSGQVSQPTSESSDSDSDSESDSDSDSDASSAESLTGRVTGTEINTRQPETSFWSELRLSVEAIVGTGDGRSVVVNPQSGVVVVRAMPTEHREVHAFLSTTQAIAIRQVVLEAKIIEVQLDSGYRQGINWAALMDVNGNPITVGQVGGGTLFDDGTSATVGNTGNLDPDALAPILGTAAAAFGGMFSVALAFNNFAAFIELLDTQGTVHVLSSPRIATLNNQKAVIKVGSDEFFVTDVSSTTTTGAATTTTPDIELTPFFSGIALDVTPQISRHGDVLLHVHPSISRVVDQNKTINVGTGDQNLPLAFSTVRESDSVVRARSGQIIVIGGLMQEQHDNNTADSPLSGIPQVGSSFGHKRESTSKSELVILLKPIVIDSSERWGDLARASARRIGAMERLAQVPGRYGQRRQ